MFHQSYTRGIFYNKIHLISPGCPGPSTVPYSAGLKHDWFHVLPYHQVVVSPAASRHHHPWRRRVPGGPRGRSSGTHGPDHYWWSGRTTTHCSPGGGTAAEQGSWGRGGDVRGYHLTSGGRKILMGFHSSGVLRKKLQRNFWGPLGGIIWWDFIKLLGSWEKTSRHLLVQIAQHEPSAVNVCVTTLRHLTV